MYRSLSKTLHLLLNTGSNQEDRKSHLLDWDIKHRNKPANIVYIWALKRENLASLLVTRLGSKQACSFTERLARIMSYCLLSFCSNGTGQNKQMYSLVCVFYLWLATQSCFLVARTIYCFNIIQFIPFRLVFLVQLLLRQKHFSHDFDFKR